MLLSSGNPRSDRAKVVVIGGSAGGSSVLRYVISSLPGKFAIPILVVLHRHPSTDGTLAEFLGAGSDLLVQEPCDKQRMVTGSVLVAPANYHMLVDRDGAVELSVDEKVNWSRPSIDVLFESAAWAFRSAVIGVILSGANADGEQGAKAIHAAGGVVIAQDPKEAEFPQMPLSTIQSGKVEHVLSKSGIVDFLLAAAE